VTSEKIHLESRKKLQCCHVRITALDKHLAEIPRDTHTPNNLNGKYQPSARFVLSWRANITWRVQVTLCHHIFYTSSILNLMAWVMCSLKALYTHSALIRYMSWANVSWISSLRKCQYTSSDSELECVEQTLQTNVTMACNNMNEYGYSAM